MERIAVVGSAGAGKTTFATELGQRTGLPVLHLDRFYWRPGWVVPDEAEWAMTQSELVERPDWIIDGNYGTQFDLRFARADTVIVLDPLDANPPASHETAIVDQINKTFVPRVSIVRTGTVVTFPNSDNIRHQVYSFSPAKEFTLKLRVRI